MPRPHKRKKPIAYPERAFYAGYFEKRKIFLKNLQEQKRSPDPENFRWSHQQPFNFFSVFAVFRAIPDSSVTPKVIDWKQKNMIQPEKKKSDEYLKMNGFYSRSKKNPYFVIYIYIYICIYITSRSPPPTWVAHNPILIHPSQH